MKKSLLYGLVGLFLFTACSKSTLPGTSDTETYREDLSFLRPEYEMPKLATDTTLQEEVSDYSHVTPSRDVTKKLNVILDSIDILRKDVRYIDGYTIQVYSGTNSEEARLARGKVYAIIPGSHPILKFEEPNFKVKVGKYYTRIEAQQTYAQLKKKFPNAIIIPQRIYIQ